MNILPKSPALNFDWGGQAMARQSLRTESEEPCVGSALYYTISISCRLLFKAIRYPCDQCESEYTIHLKTNDKLRGYYIPVISVNIFLNINDKLEEEN